MEDFGVEALFAAQFEMQATYSAASAFFQMAAQGNYSEDNSALSSPDGNANAVFLFEDVALMYSGGPVVGKAVEAVFGIAARAVGRIIGASAARGAANFSRELKAADLGVKGTVQELRGTFTLKDGVATMRVDMIRGEVRNPLQVVGNMAEAARASGATSLRIEGTIANERLYGVLQGRYGLTSTGATDSITIPLR